MVHLFEPCNTDGANIFMSLHERFKAERERLGFTQPDVATLTKVGKTTVINWEKGSSSPTAAQLEQLAKFGMDVLFVVTGAYAGGVAPAPTLSAEESTMLDYFRDAPPTLRKAALATLLSASMAPAAAPKPKAKAAASGGVSMSMSNVGDGNVQIGQGQQTKEAPRSKRVVNVQGQYSEDTITNSGPISFGSGAIHMGKSSPKKK